MYRLLLPDQPTSRLNTTSFHSKAMINGGRCHTRQVLEGLGFFSFTTSNTCYSLVQRVIASSRTFLSGFSQSFQLLSLASLAMRACSCFNDISSVVTTTRQSAGNGITISRALFEILPADSSVSCSCWFGELAAQATDTLVANKAGRAHHGTNSKTQALLALVIRNHDKARSATKQRNAELCGFLHFPMRDGPKMRATP